MSRVRLCLVVCLALVATTAVAHPVVVDGTTTDWKIALPPATANGNVGRLGSTTTLTGIAPNQSYEGEYVWWDKSGDSRTDWNNPDTGTDLTEFAVTADLTNVYFKARFQGLNGLVSGNGAPQVQIAMDLNQDGSGMDWFGQNSDVKTSTSAKWEYLVVTRFGSNTAKPYLYDSTWADKASAGALSAISNANNAIEIQIPWADLGFTARPTKPIRFTVATFHATATDDTWDSAGNADVLDCVTNYASDPGSALGTWSEVSDAVIDYYFDVWFHLTPGLDPSAPLVISEFQYDPGAPGAEPTGEWIEVFNRSGVTQTLTNFGLGDEETVDQNVSGEVMGRFPSGTIAAGSVVVVGHTTAGFSAMAFAGKTKPDFEFAANDATIPDMVKYANWSAQNIAAGTSPALGNSGDEILLLDPQSTIIDVVTYETPSQSFGMTAHAGVNDSFALYRAYVRKDTDNNNTDFTSEAQAAATPGVATDPCGDSTVGTGYEVCDEGAANGTAGHCASDCMSVLPGGSCTIGAACDDSNPCTYGTTYDASCVCNGGTTYACNDDLACTTDTCNGLGGCSFAITAGSCLIGGTCRAADEGNPDNLCQACKPATSTVAWTPLTGACNDGNACTHTDTCTTGTCAGTAYTCNDGLDCTADVCNGTGGCTAIPLAGNCVIGGVCYANDAVNPANVCQKCTVATSQTAWSAASTGAACGDGLAGNCNASGTCVLSSVVITELMYNPASCDNGSDGTGEWIELYNSTGAAIPMGGWKIGLETGTLATLPAGATIAAHDYAMVCTKTSVPAGMPCDIVAATSNFAMTNSGTHTVSLKNASDGLIDDVTYVYNATYNGKSYSLSPCHRNMVENDTGANWCVATSTFACTGFTDYGTPGSANYACAGDTCLCNNGVLDAGETCEDGNVASSDGCSSACVDEVVGAVCGNSILETGEACDDGDPASGDGCSNVCALEGGWMCSGVPTVCHSFDRDSEIVDPDGPNFVWGAFLSSIRPVSPLDEELVYALQVADWGTADALPTTLDNLVIKPGTTNDAVWTATLGYAYLIDESFEPVGAEAVITDDALTFTGLDFVVPDGGFAHLYLLITLQTGGTLVDGATLSFKVNSTTDATADPSGSTFQTDGTTTTVVSDDFILDVEATELRVTAKPATVIAGVPFTLAFSATDANGARDLDFDQDLTLSRASGTGTLSSVTGLTKPAAAGLASWSDVRYDKGEVFTVTALASGGLTVTTTDITGSETSSLDVSGYKIVNLNDAKTGVLPSGTVLAPGDYVVIGRDAVRSAFEAAWGVSLAANVHYIDGSSLEGHSANGFPIVNNAETIELRDAADVLLDGATPVSFASPVNGVGDGDNCQRVDLAGNGKTTDQWLCGLTADVAETPGTGLAATNSGKLIISEISDAAVFSNEFIELFYDGTDVCPDANKTDCVKPRFSGASCEAAPGTGFEAAGTPCAQGLCDGAGACVFNPIGGVIFTEIQANPENCLIPGGDATGEWIEIQNIRAQDIPLDGWKLEHTSASTATYTFPVGLSIAAGQRLVLCSSAPSALGMKSSGGLCDVAGLGFPIVDTNVTLRLKTAADAIDDVVTYASVTAGKSLSLSPCHLSTTGNDVSANWSAGVPTYTCANGSDWGTPGAANPPVATDTCFTCNDPLTNCPAQNVVGDCRKAVCVASAADWICSSAVDDTDLPVDNVACTGDVCTAGVPSNPPTAGLPCKTDAGLPADDGWCTGGGACVANACGDGYTFATEACDDGANHNDLDGCKDDCSFSCSPLGSVCTDDVPTDCTFPKCYAGGRGQVCEVGLGTGCVTLGTACLGGTGTCDGFGSCVQTGAAGDVILTEVMFDPAAPGCAADSSDLTGEWIELKNVSNKVLSLGGWSLGDNASPHTILSSIVMQPGALVVLCRDAAPPAWCDYSYGAAIQLSNGSVETLTLKNSASVEIDKVTGIAKAWGGGVGLSLALDPSRETSARNDLAWSWCAGQGLVECGAADEVGSPGEQNPSCTGGIVVPPDAAHSSLKATTDIAADGHSHAIVTVELRSADDTPVPNRSVTIAAGAATVVNPQGGTATLATDAQGRAIVYLTHVAEGTVTVSVTDNGPSPVTLPTTTVTFVAPITGSTATVNGALLSVNVGSFTQAAAYDPASMPALSGFTAGPYGVIGATITGVPLGGDGKVVLSVTLPSRVLLSYRLYKFGSEAGALAPHWYDVTKSASVANFKDPSVTYTMTLVDGGFGDADGVKNGTIVDPQTIVSDPAAIPTLGEWAVILLALAMVVLAVRRLREGGRSAA